VIDVWGADHHGYIPRVRGALQASGADASKLDVTLVQFVSLFRDGQKVSMSTRSGEYVTLRQLREEVGNDACRFFYMLRKCDQALDFDLDLAKSQSNDNPVYYVQYAHARICSVLAQWDGDESTLAKADLAALQHEREFALCARLAEFPNWCRPPRATTRRTRWPSTSRTWPAISTAGTTPSACWSTTALRDARLALALATRQVLRNGLALLGVSQPMSM
jgi:arginyl-tRNA synthetase